MTLTATTDLIEAATLDGSVVLAFNAITLEHAEGIAAGAEHAGASAIFQISENTARFHGGSAASLAAACARIAAGSSAPLAVHLDHFQDTELIAEAIEAADDLGVTSIMIDAAHLPYRENVERTRGFVQTAHAAGLWVEAELGEVGGKEGMRNAHAPDCRTDPDEAADFVEQTGVDALAVAVGSSHAMTTRDAVLDVDLIRELAKRVTVPLVLHGSSGVPDEQLRLAVGAGIRKVNIGTALNVAYTGAVREVLGGDGVLTDPRRYLAPARDAISATVAELCHVVGKGGNR